MRKTIAIAVAAMTACAASTASAEDIKIGVFLGFTGPIESTVANMAPGAELAIKEVSDSGKLLDGKKVVAVRGDQDPLARADRRRDRLVPVGQEAVDRVLERLAAGLLLRGKAGVARIVPRVPLVVELEHRGRRGVQSRRA